MRFTHIVVLLTLGSSLLSPAGHAQGLKAVRPIPGYVCMSLTLTEEQLQKQSALPPIFAAPSATADVVASAVGTVFAKSPLHEENGFVEILRLNGQIGWIAAQYIGPWRPLNNPNAKCIPSIMSNGRPGFSIK